MFPNQMTQPVRRISVGCSVFKAVCVLTFDITTAVSTCVLELFVSNIFDRLQSKPRISTMPKRKMLFLMLCQKLAHFHHFFAAIPSWLQLRAALPETDTFRQSFNCIIQHIWTLLRTTSLHRCQQQDFRRTLEAVNLCCFRKYGKFSLKI